MVCTIILQARYAVTVDAAGSDTIGMFNEGTCSIEVTNSRIKGVTNSISASPAAATVVAATKIDGPVYASTGTVKCFGVYDASYAAVTCP